MVFALNEISAGNLDFCRNVDWLQESGCLQGYLFLHDVLICCWNLNCCMNSDFCKNLEGGGGDEEEEEEGEGEEGGDG